MRLRLASQITRQMLDSGRQQKHVLQITGKEKSEGEGTL